jgi:hypothetical protein
VTYAFWGSVLEPLQSPHFKGISGCLTCPPAWPEAAGVYSLIDLGDDNDTLNIGSNALAGVTVRGLGGLDIMNIGAATLTSVYVNGNEGGDRIYLGSGLAMTLLNSTIVGGSENDILIIDTSGQLSGGRIYGQDGDDTISVRQIGIGTTTKIFGGQGNNTLLASFGSTSSYVIFYGGGGNDLLQGRNQAVDVRGDLLFGGDGNDSVDAIGGADTMSGGDGVYTFNGDFFSMTASIANSPTGNPAVIEAGDIFYLNRTSGIGNFNNPTANITDFSGGGGGDILNTYYGDNPSNGIGKPVISAATGDFGSGSTYKLSGVYSSADSSFTVTGNNLSSDTFIYSGGFVDSYLLLKGTSTSSLVAANFI